MNMVISNMDNYSINYSFCNHIFSPFDIYDEKSWNICIWNLKFYIYIQICILGMVINTLDNILSIFHFAARCVLFLITYM